MSSPQAWTERLNAVMPWGSSTCSKAPRFAPEEPEVIVRGKGCRVWDADGREFIDFRNALGPVTLGYCFPETTRAIREQLESGIIFGHPHTLECEVAEMLSKVIPCAEQVRFLKTGGEAIAACIRLARLFTGREHIIQIGYNGWLNSLAENSRALPSGTIAGAPPGIPRCLSALHHTCAWNDPDALDRLLNEFRGGVAAIVIAANYQDMHVGEAFYPAARQLADQHGALLICDEIVTGFRVALGGVQEYFGVIPDLTVFAKGIANGMPLAAYAGKREVMQGLLKAIVSSTYGGEALSLAAARSTISTYLENNVIGHLWEMGERMWQGFNELADTRGLPIRAEGFWPCPALVYSSNNSADLQDRFFRAVYRNGVSLYTVNYVNFSHQKSDVDEALDRLERAMKEL